MSHAPNVVTVKGTRVGNISRLPGEEDVVKVNHKVLGIAQAHGLSDPTRPSRASGQKCRGMFARRRRARTFLANADFAIGACIESVRECWHLLNIDIARLAICREARALLELPGAVHANA